MSDHYSQESTMDPGRIGASTDRDRSQQLWPVLTILSHTDPNRAGETAYLTGLANGKAVSLSRNKPDFFAPDGGPGRPVADPFISRKPIRMTFHSQGHLVLTMPAGQSLTVDGLEVEGEVTVARARLAQGVVLELAQRITLLLHERPLHRNNQKLAPALVGSSLAMEALRDQVRICAENDTALLIRGETGTGKEVTAQAIVARSGRKGPLKAVNMGTLTPSIAAAELFGAVRGAYTGAVSERKGLFTTADGGALFLDEIGEARTDVQVMLLRVLETGLVTPVGADQSVPVDTRVIAATDADLETLIKNGGFKEPLFYRLAGFEMRLPPLRERREDLGVLFLHFAREALQGVGEVQRLTDVDLQGPAWIPSPIMRRLVQHSWPGNVRQFRNIVRHLILENQGAACLALTANIERLLGLSQATSGAPSPPPPEAKTKTRKAGNISQETLMAVCRETQWDFQAAADTLGVSRGSIYLLCKRYHIPTASDLSVEDIDLAFKKTEGDLTQMVSLLQVSPRALKRRLNEMGLNFHS